MRYCARLGHGLTMLTDISKKCAVLCTVSHFEFRQRGAGIGYGTGVRSALAKPQTAIICTWLLETRGMSSPSLCSSSARDRQKRAASRRDVILHSPVNVFTVKWGGGAGRSNTQDQEERSWAHSYFSPCFGPLCDPFFPKMNWKVDRTIFHAIELPTCVYFPVIFVKCWRMKVPYKETYK